MRMTTSVCCGFLLLLLGNICSSSVVLAKSTTRRELARVGGRIATRSIPRANDVAAHHLPYHYGRTTVATRGGSSTTPPKKQQQEDDFSLLQDMFAASDDDNNNAYLDLLSLAQRQVLQGALVRKHQAKEFHNEGDYPHGAEFFGLAAQGFESVIRELLSLVQQQQNEEEASTTASLLVLIDALLAHYATFVLHQALCCFKHQDHDQCIRLCTQVLGDNEDEKNIVATSHRPLPSAIRARAFLRRAKARLALDPQDATMAALEDAKAGAFLGDAKAVALYGKCVREMTTTAGMRTSTTPNNKSPFGSSSSSSSLLSSLMGMGSNNNGNENTGGGGLGGAFNMNPLSMLLGSGLKNMNNNNNNNNGILLSLWLSLLQKAKDPMVQERICTFIHNISAEQLQSVLPPDMAKTLVNNGLLASIQPKDISRVATFLQGLVYMGQMVHRIGKVLSKYRTVICWLLVIQWTKSAIFRPIPLSGAQKKAAKAAAAAAAAAHGGKVVSSSWQRQFGIMLLVSVGLSMLLSTRFQLLSSSSSS